MKRFTETNKWKDSWFRRLTPVQKCIWNFLCEQCDAAGVIEIDKELIAFHIGEEVTDSDLDAFGDRLEKLSRGKVWIRQFIPFQYGTLSKGCKAHIPVLRVIKAHGLEDRVDRLCIPYGTPIQGVKETEEETDTEKDKGGAGGKLEAPCTIEQALAAAGNMMISTDEARHWFDSRASDHWLKGSEGNRRRVGDGWQHDMSAFTNAVRRNGGSKNGNQSKPTHTGSLNAPGRYS